MLLASDCGKGDGLVLVDDSAPTDPFDFRCPEKIIASFLSAGSGGDSSRSGDAYELTKRFIGSINRRASAKIGSAFLPKRFDRLWRFVFGRPLGAHNRRPAEHRRLVR